MIYLGADHGGYPLKEKIKAWLTEWKLQYEDLGAHQLDPEDDYPGFAFAVAEKVGTADDIKKDWKDRPKGILLCRSAIGITIAANKIKGVRAGAIFDLASAAHARTNDDVNVAAFSGDWMEEAKAKEVLKTWLETEFSRAVRHERRVKQIMGKEEEVMCSCLTEPQGCCGGGCGHD